MTWLLATLAFAEDITPTPLPPVAPTTEAPQPADSPVPEKVEPVNTNLVQGAAEPAVPAPEPTAAVPEVARPEPGTLILVDGQRISGNILRTTSGYRVFLETGVAVDFPPAAVRKMVEGEPDRYERIPSRKPPLGASSVSTQGRSIVGGTALPLGAGNAYVSQREIAATIVGVGITDGVELSGGAVVPLLASEYSRLAALGAKVSLPFGKSVVTALAVEALFVSQSGWVAPHALLTWKAPGGTYTLGGGAAVALHSADTPGLVTFSADWPLGPRVHALAEVWVVSGALPNGPGTVVMPSVATRFFLRDWSVDLGVVPFDGSFGVGGSIIPLPWFDLTWNFERQK